MSEKILGWRPEGWEEAVVATVQQFEVDDRVRATEFQELARGLIEGGASIMAMLITTEIEKVRKNNPYPEGKLASAEYYEGEGFDRACRKIIALFKET